MQDNVAAPPAAPEQAQTQQNRVYSQQPGATAVQPNANTQAAPRVNTARPVTGARRYSYAPGGDVGAAQIYRPSGGQRSIRNAASKANFDYAPYHGTRSYVW